MTPTPRNEKAAPLQEKAAKQSTRKNCTTCRCGNQQFPVPTIGQTAAQKMQAGEIIGLNELLALTPYEMELECVPDCWPDGIKTIGDLQERMYFEMDKQGEEWLVLRLRYTYRIEASRIETVPALFWWVAHLCEKTWMTREVLSMLIKMAVVHNGIKWGAEQ